MPLRRRSARAGALLLVTGSLASTLGCGGGARPASTTASAPAPAATAGARGTASSPASRRELVRVNAAAGGGIDVRAHRGDSTVSLTLRVAGDTMPRAATRVRIAAEAARWWADSIARLANRELAAGGELRLRITGVGDDGAMELVRVEAADVPADIRLRSMADSSVVALRPDEVRSLARVLRLTAVMVAPVSPEELAALQPFFEFQVEKPVVGAPGTCHPRYPEELRLAGVTGTVQVQFIVGPDGRAEPESFRVLRTAHAGFTESVREALACMRFKPAELHGRKVRQLVQQPFTFDISR